MPDLKETVGYKYITSTKHHRATIQTNKRANISKGLPIKNYPEASKKDLTHAWKLNEARIVPLLQQRRSLRTYADKNLTFAELSFLLWASQGITAKAGTTSLRTTPSAGALYPVETYLSIHRVDGLEPGLYHLDNQTFSLSLIKDKKVAEEVSRACLNQDFIQHSSVTFLWTGMLRRSMSQYGDRGLRYILLDAGHICQNVLIAAEAMDCGGCPIAAFFDDEIHDILDIDPAEEIILYAASIGKKPQ